MASLVISAPENAEKKSTPLRPIFLAASLLLAATLFFLSVRKVEWGQVFRIFMTVRFGWVALSLTGGSLALLLRSLRWRLLLTAETPVSVTNTFWSVVAGYFGNYFLPARAGEFVRTYMISRGTMLSKSYVLTTALSERIVDAMALVVISAVVMLGIPNSPDWISRLSRIFAIVTFGSIVVIAMLPRFEKQFLNFLHRLPVPEKLKGTLNQILLGVLSGIRSFHSGPRLANFLAFTSAIWFLDAIGTILTARALGMHMPLSIAFLLITALGLGSALPATPGYVGIYQFVAVSVLVPFGFSANEAMAYILFAQILAYLMITLWALIGFSRYKNVFRSAFASARP